MEVDEAKRHFIINGRICGWSEDLTAYICVDVEEDPETVFISEALYEGRLPDDWEFRAPTYEENSYGEWAYINGSIELGCGVDGAGADLRAIILEDFTLKDGTFTARAVKPKLNPCPIT